MRWERSIAQVEFGQDWRRGEHQVEVRGNNPQGGSGGWQCEIRGVLAEVGGVGLPRLSRWSLDWQGVVRSDCRSGSLEGSRGRS